MIKPLFKTPIYKQDSNGEVVYGVEICYSKYMHAHYPDSLYRDLLNNLSLPPELQEHVKVDINYYEKGVIYTATIVIKSSINE